MSDLHIDIKKIRNKFILGTVLELSPGLIFSLFEQWLESLSETITFLTALLILILLVYGYGLCFQAADKYAQYKGYKNHYYIYSILNILGLSILFLLPNRCKKDNLNAEPLLNFSISAVIISLFAITIVLMSFFYLIILMIVGLEGFENYTIENKNIDQIISTIVFLSWGYYLIQQIKNSQIKYKFILGSITRIDFKLPIIITVFKYLFASGINPIILYSLSLVVPRYVEYEINRKYATTPISWIGFAISALLIAPVLEEFLFRGLIFQKIAIQKNIVKGLFISAIAFALIHLRYDLITLFIAGIIYAVLYLKTKKLIYPILCHFFYNLIVVARKIYEQFYSGVDPKLHFTVAQYQEKFLNNWQMHILFVALSTPYLCYFIYKNLYPNLNNQELPYLSNQKKLQQLE